MTKCPRCANTKENYLQEGMNRCKVCFICWPMDEPSTPKDNPTLGQIVHFGNSPLLGGRDGQILRSDGMGRRSWVNPPKDEVPRCKICNFTAQLWVHGVPFCSIACRDRHSPKELAYQAAEQAVRDHYARKYEALMKNGPQNRFKFLYGTWETSGAIPKDEIWFVNPATLEIVGKITNIGEE